MLGVVIFQSAFCYFMLYLMRCHHDLLGLYSCIFKNLFEFLLSLPLDWEKSILPTTARSGALWAHPQHLSLSFLCSAESCHASIKNFSGLSKEAFFALFMWAARSEWQKWDIAGNITGALKYWKVRRPPDFPARRNVSFFCLRARGLFSSFL